jgi:hypothetical protein
MWSNRAFRAVSKATPLALVSSTTYCWTNNSPPSKTLCDGNLRKRATLQASLHRKSTMTELNVLRKQKTKMLQRWERDEDGWRELPARAWPAYQPDEEAMETIRSKATKIGCFIADKTLKKNDACTELLFQIATSLVFYNVDPAAGLKQFEELAAAGHVDSMVACGVILVEGMGVPVSENKGIEWLGKAVDLGSGQACYELGTVYYIGIDGVVDEDAAKAFALFERAANDNHTGALYMMADCLVEGEGVAKDVARAVPLFYRAAELGHRFARQRVRELLASAK